MKRTILFASMIGTLLLSGCMQTRYITERYIKNNVENHNEGNFSTIRTYSIFADVTTDKTGRLELTGYKYGSKKGLIIGADKNYLVREKNKSDYSIIKEVTFVELNLAQCQSILDNYQELENKIRAERPMVSEEVYHDFTVSPDLFISFRKALGHSTISNLDLWVKGEKYTISEMAIIKKLIKFINY